MEPAASSPRISFSADFLDEDEKDFISITLDSVPGKDNNNVIIKDKEKTPRCASEFEFLSINSESMITADELFFEGKLLPFWQMQHSEKLNRISLKPEKDNNPEEESGPKEEGRAVSWFLDDDPSPRPPKCTVLWKELLRLRKHRSSSSLSPSSSTSSSSSSSSSDNVILPGDESKERRDNKNAKTTTRIMKKGLERTRSATIRVRPVINMPICSQGKSTSLPPLFSFKKGKLER